MELLPKHDLIGMSSPLDFLSLVKEKDEIHSRL